MGKFPALMDRMLLALFSINSNAFAHIEIERESWGKVNKPFQYGKRRRRSKKLNFRVWQWCCELKATFTSFFYFFFWNWFMLTVPLWLPHSSKWLVMVRTHKNYINTHTHTQYSFNLLAKPFTSVKRNVRNRLVVRKEKKKVKAK